MAQIQPSVNTTVYFDSSFGPVSILEADHWVVILVLFCVFILKATILKKNKVQISINGRNGIF